MYVFEYAIITSNYVITWAGIAQCYSAGLRSGWSGGRVSVGPGNFSLHRRVQTGSRAHPAFYPTGNRGSFPGDKAAEAWSWPLTSISYRGQRMSGAIDPLPQYAFTARCLVKAQGQLYLFHLYYICTEIKFTSIILSKILLQLSKLIVFKTLPTCASFINRKKNIWSLFTSVHANP
jgi:hypothetical protein